MEQISVRPKRAQIMTNVIGLGILCGLSVAVPPLSPVCAFLTPLFACPMVRHKEEWLGWATAALPAVSWLISGWDVFLALALLAPGMLPLALTRILPAKERTGRNGVLLYSCLAAMSLALLLGVFSWRMGGAMAAVVPELITDWIRKSDSRAMLLHRLAAAGLVSIPDGFEVADLFARLPDPRLISQMLLSLRRTVELFCETTLPMLMVQTVLLTGLFTTLRTEHLNGVMLIIEVDSRKPSERKTRVTSPPGFRMLDLPAKMRAAVLGVMFLAMVLLDAGSLGQTLALMCYQLGNTVFQLLGSAVMVFVFARRSPDSVRLIGAATGLVYVIAPTVPLIIGILDTFLHYRAPKVRTPDSDS